MKKYDYLAILNDKKFIIKFEGDEHFIIENLMQVLDNAINLLNEYTVNSYDTDDDVISELVAETNLEYESAEEEEL